MTAQGQVLHQRVDGGEPETRKGTRFERGVKVSAERMGLTGKLDLVEVDLASGDMKPVEYKRGKPKQDNWDKIQLCAQALCLEEMTGKSVREGSLWYWQTRHRENIPITVSLKEETLTVINAVRSLFSSGHTPKAKYQKKCDACSLIELCSPKLVAKDESGQYVASLFDVENEA